MGQLIRRSVLLALIGGLSLGQASVTAAAGSLATFGTPTAASRYDSGVTFSQPVTVDKALARVELLLTVADAIGPMVVELPAPAKGVSVLSHLLGTSGDGHLLPNTPITARWRLVAAADPTTSQVGPPVTVIYADDRFTWQTQSGPLVRVHWSEGNADFGRRALKVGEDGVRKAADLLGVTESKPVDFYVYADQSAFYDALGPGTRENVGGEADAGIRTLFALIPPSQINDSWVGIVIPHELTHLVFATAAGNPYHFPPRWLNEGLAVYESQGYDSSDRGLVAGAVGSDTLIPLDGLVGQFPTGAEAFFLAYAESVSAVDFMIRTYGSDALVAVIRSYRDGRTDAEAFTKGLGVDVRAFEAAWMTDLGATAPTRYGPQPAPPGPVPSAWLIPGGAVEPGSTMLIGGGTSSSRPAAPAPTEGGGGDAAPLLLGILALITLGAMAVVGWGRGRALRERS